MIVMMGSTMVSPSLTLYAREFDADNFLVGLVIAAFAIGRLIADIPSGFISDRFGIKNTMQLGLGIMLTSSIISGIAPNYETLFIMRIIEGSASSLYVTAAVSFVILSYSQSKRGSVMGLYQTILMIGITIGPIVGSFFSLYFGLNSPYFLFSSLCALGLLFTHFLKSRNFSEEWSTDDNVKDEINNLGLYWNSANIATFGFGFIRSGVYTTLIPLYAYDALKLDINDVGILLTLASISNLVFSVIAGRITFHFGMRYPILFSFIVASLTIGYIPFTDSMIQLSILVTILGMTSGFFGQTVAWYTNQIEDNFKEIQKAHTSGQNDNNDTRYTLIGNGSAIKRGLGFNRLFGDLGLIIGPVIVGFILGNSLHLINWNSSMIISLIVLLIPLSLLRTKIKNKA